MNHLEKSNMAELKERIKGKVVRAYNEYKDYVELTIEENKKRHEELKEVKEVYAENKDDEEVVDFSFKIFMVDGFHKRDVEILGTRFVNYMRLYKDLPDMEELDEDIEAAYNYLKDKAKEQAFTIDKGKFSEIRKGFIEEKRKYFEENDMFNKVKGELEKYL